MGEFIICPSCGGKTRTQVRESTELKNFPLFCPKCHLTVTIDYSDGKIKKIEYPASR
jgi:Zn finger protein HypA/HybF involved in hydrogenase expression